MSNYAASSYKSSAELEREVEAQRHRVSDTIDQIQGRLSPGQMLDSVMAYTKGGGMDFAKNLGRSVTDNPLPVALVGAGLLWLMTGSGQHRSHAVHTGTAEGYGYGESDAWRRDAYASGDRVYRPGDGGTVDAAKHLGEDVAEKVSGAVSGVAGAVDDVTRGVGQATEGMSHATKDMMDRMLRQRENLTHLYEEQPLIGGALAFALGAALGAMLPHTEQEDKLFGEAADAVKRDAIGGAGDLFEEGKEAVEEGYSEIKQKVGSVIDEAIQTASQAQSARYAT